MKGPERGMLSMPSTAIRVSNLTARTVILRISRWTREGGRNSQAAGSISTIIFGALVDRVSWLAPFYVISGVMLGSALLWAFLIDPERLVTDRS